MQLCSIYVLPTPHRTELPDSVPSFDPLHSALLPGPFRLDQNEDPLERDFNRVVVIES